MDVRILGGLSVREHGVSITPTAAAPRQLLALLTASADQVVPVTVLTEELWPSGAPRGARTELQSHIAELRTLITGALRDAPSAEPGPGWSDRRTADAILVSQPGGYRLDTGGGTNDVRQFERAAGAGYRAMEAGDLDRAALRLGEALALWRGEPYAGVAAGPRLRREVERLETSRLSVLDQWVEAQLGLGRHAELVPELSGLVARYRTNEPLHAHYMVALLRCGQHDEALTVYERLRTALKGESGMEPSARLRRLQRSVLAVRTTEVRPLYASRVPAQFSAPRARLVPAGSVG
ncbi:DNA-binding SARP family transcriptional activator [Streptomyces sp. PvR006]|uniref:AfsR/SARP family transcriptional regulator n=1 Tax=Streptomyces sp. PvR006 TaxID=2817860 RepID=UPI001AE28B2A|nr:AfsR/SARP family transcriptional regulator [Streptomyces sp. PvR006]MBP2582264.1 DNA-binding SARP family transcriptional activator [Streptomyces sp. PvR006]